MTDCDCSWETGRLNDLIVALERRLEQAEYELRELRDNQNADHATLADEQHRRRVLSARHDWAEMTS